MATNRTSETVDAFLLWFDIHGTVADPMYFTTQEANEATKAICERSKRMEEALRSIGNQEHGEGNETSAIANEALVFDPLSE